MSILWTTVLSMEEEKWAVAHLSPRRKAPASPRHSRLRKFYSRAEGHMLCRAVAVLAESHVVAVLAIPSPRAAPRRRAVLVVPAASSPRAATRRPRRAAVVTKWPASGRAPLHPGRVGAIPLRPLCHHHPGSCQPLSFELGLSKLPGTREWNKCMGT